MKSYREELWFEIGTRRAFINITPQVETVLRKSRVQEGLLLVNAMHITASVYINDDEPGLLKDYEDFLERLAPQQANYRHNQTGEDNWRCAHQAADHGTRSHRGGDQRETRLRTVGADFVWGVRWQTSEASVCEGHWRVKLSGIDNGVAACQHPEILAT